MFPPSSYAHQLVLTVVPTIGGTIKCNKIILLMLGLLFFSNPALGQMPPGGVLGDRVWNDGNRNGQQDFGEPGIAGVTVMLNGPNDAFVASVVTDGSGNYQFTNLAPGVYRITFTLVAGFTFSPANVGADATGDSDANPTTGQTQDINLLAGVTDLTWDAGMYQPAGSLGDFVWNDVNANGLQDVGETGIAGVSVSLVTAGGILVATTTTDASGNYRFTNLSPGVYQIRFTLLAGFTFSPANVAGSDAIDSDANPTTGQTPDINLLAGVTDLTWDAGMYQPAGSLGNFVWNDVNANGLQDIGETGIPGVSVSLFTAGGVQVATTTTNASGNYQFTNLAPGVYQIRFTLLAGFTFSPANVAGSDAIDSDANPTTGQTPDINLLAGVTDNTWDAGMYQPTTPAPTPTPTAPTPTPTAPTPRPTKKKKKNSKTKSKSSSSSSTSRAKIDLSDGEANIFIGGGEG